MPHVLILGRTESGKSTLAKAIAKQRKASGRGVIVLDPMRGHWEADFQTANESEFMRVVWDSECCDVFIDEAGEAIGHYNKTMIKLATQGRHWGHNVYFVCQRANMVSPTVRTQCRILFAFNQAYEDAQVLAREWGFEELLTCNRLPQGSYYYAETFGDCKLGKVF